MHSTSSFEYTDKDHYPFADQVTYTESGKSYILRDSLTSYIKGIKETGSKLGED